jgi:phosphopantothenoylcysteine decarboxylase
MEGSKEPAAAPAPQKKNVLLGVSGSVATIKAAPLCKLLSEFANVRIVTTKSAFHFLDKNPKGETIPEGVQVFQDEDEWNQWQKLSDPVLHIEVSCLL